jgi:hypothetical protein
MSCTGDAGLTGGRALLRFPGGFSMFFVTVIGMSIALAIAGVYFSSLD